MNIGSFKFPVEQLFFDIKVTIFVKLITRKIYRPISDLYPFLGFTVYRSSIVRVGIDENPVFTGDVITRIFKGTLVRDVRFPRGLGPR